MEGNEEEVSKERQFAEESDDKLVQAGAVDDETVVEAEPEATPTGSSRKKKKKKKKKGKIKHKRTYVDVIVVEAKDITLPTSPPDASVWSSIGGLFTAKSNPLPDAYCCLSVGEHVFTTTVCNADPLPIWNENCTFSTTREQSQYGYLLLEVLDRTDRTFGSDQVIAKLSIPFANVPSNELLDVWLDLYHTTLFVCPPSASSSSGTASSTTSSSAMHHGVSSHPASFTIPMSAPAEQHAYRSEPCFGGALPRPTPTCRLHLMIHKSDNAKAGILRHLGKPQKLIPLRMNVGDLILINSSAFITHGVKLGTGSKWDHVAMVTRSKKTGKLTLFEATTDGVATYTLRSALHVYRNNSTIGVRRLKVERTPEMMDALDKFIREVEGKPYTRSLGELIKAAYGTNESEDTNSLFCSQLVAKALQRMRIIGEEHLCNNFLPAHFELPDLGAGVSQSVIGPINEIPQMQAPLPKAEIGMKNAGESIECSGGVKEAVGLQILDSLEQVGEDRKTFTEYIIQVQGSDGSEWRIFRRYSLFHKLHKELSQHFKGLAALPPKTLSNRTKMSRDTIRTRQRALEAYLCVLLNNETTSHSRWLQQFLMPTERDAQEEGGMADLDADVDQGFDGDGDGEMDEDEEGVLDAGEY